MKKNKLTKLALALGTVATIAAPIATVVSCGSGTNDSNSVVIKYTWAANGPQIKALQPVVDYYNKNVATKDDLKVKLVHVEGGYGDAMKLDTRDISMNNMGPVADAIIDYPDSLGSLTSKALDFKSGVGANIEDLFEGGSKDTYVTTEVEGNKTSGVFSLPLAKSTEMLSIDIPFMAALVDKRIIAVDGKVKTAVDAYKTDNKNESEIAKIVKSLGKVTMPTSAIVIDDTTINNYDKLFGAADEIAKAVEKINPKSAMHVVGEDAPTNLLYQLFNSRVGYDMDKFIFHHKADGTFDYSTLKGKESNGGKVLNKLLSTLGGHIKEGALVLNGGGAYSSSDFVDHKLPFVIGSTAGWSHNYKGQAAFGVKGETGDPIPLSGYNSEITAPSAEAAAKGAIAMTTDKYHNPVLGSTYSGTVGEHDYKVKDAATDAKIKAAISSGKVMVLKSGAKATDGDLVVKGKFNYSFVSGKKVAVKPGSDPDHVNPEEVLSLGAPQKSNTADGNEGTKTQILSQGPSFIGIKHGGKKDTDTIKFMEWFFNPKSVMTDANGKTSPIDSFDNASGYITPVVGAFADANKSKYKDGNLVAFNAFADVTTAGDDGIAFDNPVSRFSSDIRKSAEAGLKTIYTNEHSGIKQDMNSLYGDFVKSFSLD